MTLLTICQNAADEIGIDQPATIISNTEPSAVRLLRYANKVGKALNRMHDWQVMTKAQTFTGVNAFVQGAVGDGVVFNTTFVRFIPESMWDQTNDRMISGPIQNQIDLSYNTLVASSTTGARYWSFRSNNLTFYPKPAGTETIAYLYIADFWANTVASQKSEFTADTDTPQLDEELITFGVKYQFLKDRGLPWESAYGDFMALFKDLVANDRPESGVLTAGDLFSGGRHHTGEPKTQTTFGLFT